MFRNLRGSLRGYSQGRTMTITMNRTLTSLAARTVSPVNEQGHHNGGAELIRAYRGLEYGTYDYKPSALT